MAPSEVLGVALAGGSGVRARPLTLKATNYIRSKATVRFLGRRVIDWELLSFKAQGIVNFLVLAKGKANRYQIKGQVGYGEGLASTSGTRRGRSTRWTAVLPTRCCATWGTWGPRGPPWSSRWTA